MSNTLQPSVSIALGLALAGLSLAASAQSDAPRRDALERVQVQGQPLTAPRSDVRASCPAMENELKERLGWALQQHQRSGVVRVDFELGAAASPREVQVNGGPAMHYRQAIRRVMHDQHCLAAPADTPQRYSMLLSFNAPDDHPGSAQAVALLEPR